MWLLPKIDIHVEVFPKDCPAWPAIKSAVAVRPGDPFFLKALKKRDNEASITSTAVILGVTPMSAPALKQLEGNLPAPFNNPVVKYEKWKFLTALEKESPAVTVAALANGILARAPTTCSNSKG